MLRSVSAFLIGAAAVCAFAQFVLRSVPPVAWWLLASIAALALLLDLLWARAASGRGNQAQAVADGRTGVQRWLGAHPTGEHDARGAELIDFVSIVALTNGHVYRRTQRSATPPESFAELGIGGSRLVVQPDPSSSEVMAARGGSPLAPLDQRLALVPAQESTVPPWPGVFLPPGADISNPYAFTEWDLSRRRQPTRRRSWAARPAAVTLSFLVGLLASGGWQWATAGAGRVTSTASTSAGPTRHVAPSEAPTLGDSGGGTVGTDQEPLVSAEEEREEPAEHAEEHPAADLLHISAEEYSRILAGMAEFAGTEEVGRIVLYDEYLMFDMPAETGSNKWDTFTYEADTGFNRQGPATVQLDPSLNERFLLTDLDPTVIADVNSRAVAESGQEPTPSLEFSHVIIDRALWGATPGKTSIRAYVGDDYTSTMLVYDTTGKLIKKIR